MWPRASGIARFHSIQYCRSLSRTSVGVLSSYVLYGVGAHGRCYFTAVAARSRSLLVRLSLLSRVSCDLCGSGGFCLYLLSPARGNSRTTVRSTDDLTRHSHVTSSLLATVSRTDASRWYRTSRYLYFISTRSCRPVRDCIFVYRTTRKSNPIGAGCTGHSAACARARRDTMSKAYSNTV